MILDIFLKLGLAILVGIIGGKISNRFGLPKVSGYIVGGLIIGPSIMKLFSLEELGSLGFINDIALGCIAFGIGNSFLLSDLKEMGKNALIITVAEVAGAVIIVFSTMYFIFDKSLAFSLVMASMSASTAPAGLVLVINELKADGPLVRNILPVAAFDDALGIMVFGVASAVAKLLISGGNFSLTTIVGKPLIEMVLSVVIGFLLGMILAYTANKVKDDEQLVALSSLFILLSIGISKYLNISTLLTNMVMGGVVINATSRYKRIFNSVKSMTPPLNILFFVLAGANLELGILNTVGLIGVGYIIARGLGKVIGAGFGAKIVNAEGFVQKYLGISLLTQGGISIGLAMSLKQTMPELGNLPVTIILFSVLIFEILGPAFTKYTVTKVGEVNGMLQN